MAIKMSLRKVRRECKTSLSADTAPKGVSKNDKKGDSDVESIDDEPAVNVGGTLIGEFRKRHRFNSPTHHQVYGRIQ